MRTFISRQRFRRVRSQAQQAGRPKHERAIRDSNTLRIVLGIATWGLALWLVMPTGPADWRALAARGVALMIIGFGGQMLLRVIHPREALARSAWLLMLAMLLLAILDVHLSTWVLERLLLAERLDSSLRHVSPHALVPLLVAMLYGGPTALVIGLMAGTMLALAAGFDLAIFLLALCATAVAACEAPRLRYRVQVVRTLARIFLWQTPIVLVMTLIGPEVAELRSVVIRLAALLLWLAVSGILVILVLPLAERLTRRTSDYSLNTFADLGQALLQRMTLEAPGTYHHSMMVANLAQAAADRIGANGLLARIGAYYHDIGKLGRPQFYMENQMRGRNPHDDLPPNISRMIIVNHVKEGLVLARLHHLPGNITRFITTHHGTSVIRWFHHKAQCRAGEQNDAASAVESHYRYAGPLPTSREETIVSLADSIEAAARALPKTTPGHIENLVSAICRAKWLDGQLDQSLLTNAELSEVRQSFIFTLTHLLHARLAYPPHEPHTDSQPPTSAPS